MARTNALDYAGSLERAAEIVTEGTAMFTSEQIAGQYAFDAARESGQPLSAEALSAHLDILADAGARFDFEEAMNVALLFSDPMKVNFEGRVIDIKALRTAMDDDLCERIHGTVETEQEFLDAYLIAHQEKFGESFVFG